jgi:hypothetical protein
MVSKMSIREVQTKTFDSLIDYLDFHSYNYHNQIGIKICGLRPLDNDKYEAEYIELY